MVVEARTGVMLWKVGMCEVRNVQEAAGWAELRT